LKEAAMATVRSNDGTAIDDRMGEGPVVIFVDGALSMRGGKADRQANRPTGY
jgi:hypothetical protein